jgi:hypothetical protein
VKLILTLMLFAALVMPARADKCFNAEAAAQQLVKEDGQLLKVLEGDALDKFHQNYTARFGKPAPNDHRVEFWVKPKSPNWLLVSYTNGCVTGVAEVDPRIATELIEGEPT